MALGSATTDTPHEDLNRVRQRLIATGVAETETPQASNASVRRWDWKNILPAAGLAFGIGMVFDYVKSWFEPPEGQQGLVGGLISGALTVGAVALSYLLLRHNNVGDRLLGAADDATRVAGNVLNAKFTPETLGAANMDDLLARLPEEKRAEVITKINQLSSEHSIIEEDQTFIEREDNEAAHTALIGLVTELGLMRQATPPPGRS